ncbi:SnoaL-like domain-containing protein [Polynucleobacter meluiroseus]|jgi:SnoaL-like domain|uniref:SnoaL-like domain-containing protein n=1 Tax=Polynucleobacter meluiroseus TaxID=1938814 RepID=A0A240DXK2_9BURK|nr:nuclear transport factor 2 family protein [Polynucleobacter meluiroseus]SNX27925.1 SnoaL-like domain-containing protein [Polynucleobacter meluiroseus]
MLKLARLFHNADEVVDALRECLKNQDVKGALAIWLDDDSITCVLPEGQRLSGHEEIRAGLERLLAKQALFLEPIACINHSVLGAAIYDSTEAVHLRADQIEAEFFLNITLVLLQDSQGWRLAHLHASHSTDDTFDAPSTPHGLH